MNEINNIKGSNAPPLASQKAKVHPECESRRGKRQKAEFLHPFVQDFFPHLGGNVRRTKGVTLNFELCTLNLPDRATTLLKMRDGFIRNAQRDGPRGREPDIGLARHEFTAGVPATLYPSVYLCEFSVDSVVKNIKPQRTRRRHREHGEILYTRKHNDFSPVLLGVCLQAGEKNVLRTEGCPKKVFSIQSQFTVCHLEVKNEREICNNEVQKEQVSSEQ